MGDVNNGNGMFVKVVIGVVGVLSASGIIGLVALGNEQSALKENVKTNTERIADSKEAVSAVPIIKRDIEYIKENQQKDLRRSEEQYMAIIEAIKRK